jgi:hypothetical protein
MRAATTPVDDAYPFAYVVTQEMPERDGEFEYRVRSSYEPHERVVRESQLRGAIAPTCPRAK